MHGQQRDQIGVQDGLSRRRELEAICFGDTKAGTKISEVFIQTESVSQATPADEVEAEERRQQNGDANLDEEQDSDDEPIISSHVWQALEKTSKKSTTARKAPAGVAEGSPTPSHENKPSHQLSNGPGRNLRKNPLLRANSESIFDGSITAPPGTKTPAARLDQPLLCATFSLLVKLNNLTGVKFALLLS